MSRARRVTDADRTAIMVDLLHRRHAEKNGEARAYVVLEEVAPNTGWAVQRWADVLVLSVWSSNGLTLDGWEVKASRQDLRRELAEPDKHQATARYCDTWNLLVWDEAVVAGLDVPADWGLWTVTGDEDSGRELKRLRAATKRTPEAWPRSFICSMVRNAYEQSPGAAWVARVAHEAASRAHQAADYRHARETEALLRPLCKALFGPTERQWRLHDAKTIVRMSAERLMQLPLHAPELRSRCHD